MYVTGNLAVDPYLFLHWLHSLPVAQ